MSNEWGNHETYDVACVKVNIPFLTTRTKYVVLPKPRADFITGNVRGVNDCDFH